VRLGVAGIVGFCVRRWLVFGSETRGPPSEGVAVSYPFIVHAPVYFWSIASLEDCFWPDAFAFCIANSLFW
jgi:hypothetical protein